VPEQQRHDDGEDWPEDDASKQDRWHDAIAHWERVAKVRALEPTGLLKKWYSQTVSHIRRRPVPRLL